MDLTGLGVLALFVVLMLFFYEHSQALAGGVPPHQGIPGIEYCRRARS